MPPITPGVITHIIITIIITTGAICRVHPWQWNTKRWPWQYYTLFFSCVWHAKTCYYCYENRVQQLQKTSEKKNIHISSEYSLPRIFSHLYIIFNDFVKICTRVVFSLRYYSSSFYGKMAVIMFVYDQESKLMTRWEQHLNGCIKIKRPRIRWLDGAEEDLWGSGTRFRYDIVEIAIKTHRRQLRLEKMKKNVMNNNRLLNNFTYRSYNTKRVHRKKCIATIEIIISSTVKETIINYYINKTLDIFYTKIKYH